LIEFYFLQGGGIPVFTLLYDLF